MSKFDYDHFYGGYDSFAVSKEKFTKEEAIEIAKVEMETVYLKKPYYLCISDGFVRHRAGRNEDNEPCVGWWIEYKENKRSCPCWVFHLSKLDDEETFFGDKYERILIE